jgi:ABC-type branched-subunit amino acid transport system permease subunit
MASLGGPVLSAALLTLLEYADALIPGLSRQTADTLQQWVPDVYGLAIVLVVLFAPGGLGSLWRARSSSGEGR